MSIQIHIDIQNLFVVWSFVGYAVIRRPNGLDMTNGVSYGLFVSERAQPAIAGSVRLS